MKTIKDMTNQKLFYFSIFFSICESYGIIVTLRKIINDLVLTNDFVFLRLAGIFIVFCLFFFARPNIYWKIGYILFLSAAILNITAILYVNILIIPLHLISLLLSVSAVFCFFKFIRISGRSSSEDTTRN